MRNLSRSAPVTGGGTISGDLTIDGDLTVNGDGSGNFDEIVNGNLELSVADAGGLNVYNATSNHEAHFKLGGTAGVYKVVADNADNSVKLGSINGTLSFAAAGSFSTRMIITSAGKVQIIDTGASGANVGDGAALYLKKDDGQPMANNDVLGEIIFQGAENTTVGSDDLITGARIYAHNSRGSAWDSSNNHTDLVFATTTGDASLAERMRITDDGNVGIGKSDSVMSGLAATNTKLTIYNSSYAGNLELAGNSSSDDALMGSIWFSNEDNADDTNIDADSKLIAAIDVRIETSDSNAHDDSGSHIIFKTKPEAGTLAEGMRIDSAGNLILSKTANTTWLTAPSLVFGDGDTGIYEYSDDQLRFAHGGSTNLVLASAMMIFNNNGGTTSPVVLHSAMSATVPGFTQNGDQHDGIAVLQGSVNIITNQTSKMIIDDNSRISLSNNDGNTSNTIFGKNAFVDDSQAVLGDVGADYNVVIGELAMGTGDTTTALYNTAVGYKALEDMISGNANVAVGSFAGANTTTGASNVAIGAYDGSLYGALHINQVGSFNVAIGTGALATANDNKNDGSVAIGHQAAFSKVATGTQYAAASVHIGYASGATQTTGTGNTSVGHATMGGLVGGTALTGSDNTVMGYSAGYAMSGASNANTLIGSNAGVSLTTGDYNTAIGSYALNDLVGTEANTAIGVNSATDLVSGSYNVLLGNNTLDSANATESGNVAVGYNAMYGVDEGENAGSDTVSADDNVAVGRNALLGGDMGDASSSSGSDRDFTGNIAIGAEALDATAANPQTGTIAIGHQALTALTSGAGNVAIGYNALLTTSTDTHNTVIGYEAAKLLDGGSDNTIIGYKAFDGADGNERQNVVIGSHSGGSASNNSTDDSVLIGYQAGFGGSGLIAGSVAIGAAAMSGTGTIGGTGNIAIGNAAIGGSWSGSTSNYNIGIGRNTIKGVLNGAAYNVAVGDSGLSAVTSGTYNVAVGSGAGNLTTSGSNNTLIGYEADVEAATDSYQVKIGYYGIIKYKTARVLLNNSYTGTPAEHDAAHTNSLFNIPSYSYISKISVKVITLSANGTATFSIYKSATLTTASGAALNGDRIELLGANAEDNAGIKVRSQNAQTADSDIVASSGGTANMVWISNIDVTVDNSVGWIADANSGVGWGIYIGHAGGNTGSDGGADAELDIMVEYY